MRSCSAYRAQIRSLCIERRRESHMRCRVGVLVSFLDPSRKIGLDLSLPSMQNSRAATAYKTRSTWFLETPQQNGNDISFDVQCVGGLPGTAGLPTLVYGSASGARAMRFFPELRRLCFESFGAGLLGRPPGRAAGQRTSVGPGYHVSTFSMFLLLGAWLKPRRVAHTMQFWTGPLRCRPSGPGERPATPAGALRPGLG